MKYASFFTGIAGFERGFSKAGHDDPSAMVEWDTHCQTILRTQYPHVNLMGDIANVTASDLGRPRAFVAGFPCQNTSVGPPIRLGLAGPQSGQYTEFARLLYEYQRLIDDSGPRWVVLENPVGLLSSPGVGKDDGVDRTGWDMAAVARSLEDLGYGWAYRVVDGRYLGTPQKRERVIVVGHRGGDPRPAWEVLADDGAGARQARPRTQRAGAQARPVAAGNPSADGGRVAVWRKSARATKSLAAGGYETWVPAEFGNTLTGFDYGGPARQTHIVMQGGRLRTLTLREWERLQGFPDDWTEGVPDSARGHMLGNAMHVGMAEWLGHRLATVDAALPQIGA